VALALGLVLALAATRGVAADPCPCDGTFKAASVDWEGVEVRSTS